MQSADDLRSAQREIWAGLSVGWDKWDSITMDHLAPVGRAMIQSLNVVADQQHLEIACGTGEPGLSIAILAPQGHVVLTDLAPEMLEIARRRASARGISNFETLACSADDLPFDDAKFDSVSVRFGYMYFPDMAKATQEFLRVLKPGGRLCSAVWIKPAENPWTSLFMNAVATEMEIPAPDSRKPDMFRCAVPGYVSAFYQKTGFIEVVEWEVEVELVARSPIEYWEMMSERVSLAVAALALVDKAAHERIRDLVINAASAFEEDGKVRIPGLARCIVGTKQ